jgi:hypothetical protein
MKHILKVIFMVALTQNMGLAQDWLSPEESPFTVSDAFLVQYYAGLRNALVPLTHPDAPQVRLGMIAIFPYGRPEFAVWLEQKSTGAFAVGTSTADSNLLTRFFGSFLTDLHALKAGRADTNVARLLMFSHPKDLHVSLARKNLDRKYAIQIDSILSHFFHNLKTERPNLGLDGTTFHFFYHDFGALTDNPRDGTRAGQLVSLFMTLREYALQPTSNVALSDSIQAKIDSLQR